MRSKRRRRKLALPRRLPFCNMDVVYNSAVDVLIDALKRTGRETYLHALVYFGEHKCQRNALADNFAATVTKQMEAYHDEALTGYLLIYSNKFINLVEGSESVIMHHLNDVVKMMERPEMQIGPSAQVFLEICHIKKRMFASFQTALATPPTLAQQFPVNPGVEEVYRHINNFYEKYFKLMEITRKISQTSSTTINLDVLGSRSALMLPEAELVHFLLRSHQLLSLQSVVAGHKIPPYFELYDDRIWPLSKSNLPYHVFLDQLNVEKEEELEEEKEEESKEEEKEEEVGEDKLGDVSTAISDPKQDNEP